MGRRGMLMAAVVAAALLAPTFDASGQSGPGGPAVPTVSDPPAGLRGHAMWDSYFDLGPFGYEEREYFVSGTAASASGATAPFTTRIIVAQPSDPSAFNGAVLLDWVNVTAQFENAVDTMLARELLLREGFAYVHVSAQAAGLCCVPLLTPQLWDPVRYAAIHHPGDDFGFDIFTQVARAIESGGIVDGVDRVLAAGQSQSANRLADYVEEWLPAHPDAVGAIDGFLVHGNVPGRKSFAAASPVPVLQLLSDFEAVDDGIDPATVGPNYRLWEVAGTSHADHFIGYQSVFGHGPRVLLGAPRLDPAGFRSVLDAAGTYGEVVSPLLAVCVVAGAAMPMRYAASAALYQLDRWVAGGPPPPNGPRFAFAGGTLAKDGYGNTLGGIRLPPIDVPVARYVSTICALGGITIPFLDPELQATYGTYADYEQQLAAAADRAVAAGWLLPEDAVDLLRRACRIRSRFGAGAGGGCTPYAPPAFGVPLESAGGPSTSSSTTAPPAPAATSAAPRTALPATGGTGVAPLAVVLVLIALGATAVRRRPSRVRS